MRKVFLLTGFQNWGKTWLIERLFSRQRFYHDTLYDFADCLFCVMPKSNDDLGKLGYEAEYQKKIEALKKHEIQPKYIFSAFCPTKEEGNKSSEILHELYANDEVIMIPIEYKWCGHAKLQLAKIEQHYSAFKQMSIRPLSQSDPQQKLRALEEIVRECVSDNPV